MRQSKERFVETALALRRLSEPRLMCEKETSRPMLAHRNGSKDDYQVKDSKSGKGSQCLGQF